MSPKKEGALAVAGIIILAVLVAFLAVPGAIEGGIIHMLMRLSALYGYLFLGIATMTTPFLKEVTQFFGKPFLTIHHVFSVFGIALITLHPISNAIQRGTLAVFVPNFNSWHGFWALAGRPAFIIIYVAVFAALLRTKALNYWRPFHALMYVALFFGIVHGNLIGEDFRNPWIMLIFDALFALSLTSFVVKRYRNYQRTRQQILPNSK